MLEKIHPVYFLDMEIPKECETTLEDVAYGFGHCIDDITDPEEFVKCLGEYLYDNSAVGNTTVCLCDIIKDATFLPTVLKDAVEVACKAVTDLESTDEESSSTKGILV